MSAGLSHYARVEATPSSGGVASTEPRQGRLRIGLVLAIIVVLVVAALAAFALTENRGPPLENVQVESIQPVGVVVQFSGVNMTMTMVIHNPNAVKGTVEHVSYTLSAGGAVVGNGQAPSSYSLPPSSNSTVSFPVNSGWGAASSTAESYFVAGGSMNWEINGTIASSFSGHTFSLPFQYSGVFGF